MIEKIAEYICCEPDPNESVLESGWADEDDLILCLDEMEEEGGFELSEPQLESIFSGEMKVAELIQICESMLMKEAKITSQRERAHMREYRLRNKAVLARKAKKRAKLTKAGIHRPKMRVGSAAGGFTFVQKANAGPSVNTAKQSAHSTSVGMAQYDFNPMKNTGSSSRQVTLNKYAEDRLMALGLKHIHDSFENKRDALAVCKQNLHKYAELMDAGIYVESVKNPSLDYEGAQKIALSNMYKNIFFYKEAAVGEEIENRENPIAGKLGYPTPPSKKGQVKPPKPGEVPQPPKVKSSLTTNSLPANKVNRRPSFNENSR